MGQCRILLFIFVLLNNFSSQQGSISDCWNSRRGRWPLDHPHGLINIIFLGSIGFFKYFSLLSTLLWLVIQPIISMQTRARQPSGLNYQSLLLAAFTTLERSKHDGGLRRNCNYGINEFTRARLAMSLYPYPRNISGFAPFSDRSLALLIYPRRLC